MTRPAIVVPVITQLVEETRVAIEAMEAADAREKAFEIRFTESRDEARARRLELGALLRKARATLPTRGSREDGWGSYLEAIGMPETTARRYMGEADAIVNRPGRQSADLADSEAAHDSSLPRDEDAPLERAVERDDEGGLLVPGEPSEPEIEIDRDTWCTPLEIAEALGDFDLDPCSNERSHIQAAREFRLEGRGEDGLFFASKVDANTRAFINPPYSDVTPWIESYAHTRFCFLLKLDPSTKWFARLFSLSELILVPRGTRVEFEPPPGVPPEKAKANPFPHALFYARASDATKAIRDYCFSPWRTK